MTDLVGQRINLKVTTSTNHYGKELTIYEIDDPEMENRIKLTYGNDVRIILPGQRFLLNMSATRINVHVSIDGTITKINNG